MKKTETRSVRELRIRLVQQVAAPKWQAITLSQQADGLENDMKKIVADSKKLLADLGNEVISSIEIGRSVLVAMDVDKRYSQYSKETAEKLAQVKKQMEEIKKQADELHKKAREALVLIGNDVLAGMYGPGKLELTQQGLYRIIGCIEELDESTSCAGISLRKPDDISRINTRSVAQMCEQHEQRPPLFRISTELMPLSEKELASLCRETDDYKLLIANIPEDLVLWRNDTVLCVERNDNFEIYLVPTEGENVILVRAEKMIYPHCQIEVLGQVVRSKEVLWELTHWGGAKKIPVEVGDAFNVQQMALKNIEEHISRKHPGLIIAMPQLEM